MAEKPILMSAWSVLALLDKRKVQTRRPVKPQPPEGVEVIDYSDEGSGLFVYDEVCGLRIIATPKYELGDELWVREALVGAKPIPGVRPVMWYQADQMPVQVGDRVPQWRWQRDKLPGIFMPKAAARIWRTVTRVRCEPVQDITIEEAIAEGVPPQPAGAGGVSGLMCRLVCVVRDDLPDAPQIAYFAELWNSIYTKPPFRFEDNPYVFVYDMEDSRG